MDNSPKFIPFSKKKRFDDEDEDQTPKRVKTFRYVSDVSEFRCVNCKRMISAPGFGTEQRNHCPFCLFSLHVDTSPGDRKSECGSKMEPIAIWVKKLEWILLHRCMGCGVIHSNRIAPDDNESYLIHLAAQAMAKPSFPLV